MKYRIIGADGKMYGPVGLEQIRQWLAEGRTDSRTPVLPEGAADWTYLGLLPELAAAFTASPAAPGATVRPAPMARGTNGFATAGLVCSLLAWTCCCCGLPFGLLGLIFSLVALVQINSQSPPQEGRLLAIAGLVLSATNLLFGLAALIWQLAFGTTTINWQNGHF